MKLSELKQETYEAWERLSSYRGALVQPEHFKPDVRVYGDLRYRETWQKAYGAFVARNIFDANTDNRSLITIQLHYTPERWDWDLRHQILDQFLAIPGGMDCITNGLEQILRYPIDQEEQDIAHGVFELVQEQSGRAGSIAARSVGQLPVAHPL